MEQIATLGAIEIVGWIASLLTVATYAMNTMMPLRILAIASSLCFIFYAVMLQLWPLLVTELILLPINCYRLWQIVTLRGRLSDATATAGSDFSVIKSYGSRRRIPAGTTVFSRGDPVERLYLVDSGRVMIEEFGAEISAGDIFGEIGFFTDAATRTATARCVEDTVVYEMDRKRFMRLHFEDPGFGLSVMRTVTRRLAAANRASIAATDLSR